MSHPAFSLKFDAMIYLDNAATSFPKPEPVYQALDRFGAAPACQPGRPATAWPWRADKHASRHAAMPSNQLFHGCIADTLDLHAELHLTRSICHQRHGSTAAITLSRPTSSTTRSAGRAAPCAEKAGTIALTGLASDRGYLDPDAIRRAQRPKTALVGHDPPAERPRYASAPRRDRPDPVAERAPCSLLDAAQSAGVVPIDLLRTPIDFLAFPGHKALYRSDRYRRLYVGRVPIRAPGEKAALAVTRRRDPA